MVDPIFNRRLGEFMRKARHRRGYTILELSRRSGLQTGHLSLLENGKRTPSALTLDRWASALHIRVRFPL